MQDTHSFEELLSTGLLWLINKATLHPRGYALNVVLGDDGRATGWTILGDGTTPFSMDGVDENEKFGAVEALLAEYAAPIGSVNGDFASLIARLERLEHARNESEARPKLTLVPPLEPAADVAGHLLPDGDRPLAMAVPLSQIQRARPVFERASFAASYANDRDPNPVSGVDGSQNGGVRY